MPQSDRTASAAPRRDLDRALMHVADARELVGQHIPDDAKLWAEENGLAVRETSFAPPDKLFIMGATPAVHGDVAEVGR